MLDGIVEGKRREVAELRRRRDAVERAASGTPRPADFTAALTRGSHVAVIGEVKRRSPSAGEITPDVSAVDVARRYAAAGIAAISVLTDRDHFGGELADLEAVHAAVEVPLLRKDFTIDPVQIFEARAAGASAVLLIVRILTDAQLAELGRLAADLGLAALVEVHDAAELERAVAAGARLIGINNRDLATFTTDLHVTQRLAPLAPPGSVVVGESGIRSAADVAALAASGVSAVLVGESLMRAPDPVPLARALSSVPRRAVA